MSVIKQEVPRELVDFQNEIIKHPDLLAVLQSDHIKTFEEGLAYVAAELGIIVDGLYDVGPLCKLLTERLYARRTIDVQEVKDTTPSLALPLGSKLH